MRLQMQGACAPCDYAVYGICRRLVEAPEFLNVGAVNNEQVDVGLGGNVLALEVADCAFVDELCQNPSVNVQASLIVHVIVMQLAERLCTVSAHGEDLDVGVANSLQRCNCAHRAVVNVGDDVVIRLDDGGDCVVCSLAVA